MTLEEKYKRTKWNQFRFNIKKCDVDIKQGLGSFGMMEILKKKKGSIDENKKEKSISISSDNVNLSRSKGDTRRVRYRKKERSDR